MLLSLRIENFALIDCLDLDFGRGLNVLTGETGAGKSIILDALDAVLGGKCTGRAIRTGTGRSLIEATFELEPPVAAWVRDQEIELLDGTLLVVSRELVFGKGGAMRSRSRLNGVLVNRQLMEQLRDRLVEITAQGQTVQLGQPARQRDWLDAFAGPEVLAVRQAVVTHYAEANAARQALEDSRQSEQQRLQRIDLLDYQVKELSEANLHEAEELEQLEQERQRLSHVVELQEQSDRVYQALYQQNDGSFAAADLLGEVEQTLRDMVAYDPELQAVLDMVNDALALAIEAGRQMSSYSSSLEADPDRLAEVEQRIAQLKQICRKYGPNLSAAIAYFHRIEAELEELTQADRAVEVLERLYQARQGELIQSCQKLTLRRRTAALRLEQRLIEELKPLAMDNVQFQVQIEPVAPTSTGSDRIMFLFSPNPGEPLQPVAEIASGGEMSRFLLALQSCFVQVDSAATLVFDEIDAGVSGRVAGAIAQKLHQLSQGQQVLFVTHQPIVAAMADFHFRVNKQVIGSSEETPEASDPELQPTNTPGNGSTPPAPIAPEERTVVRVTALSSEQRREELAQLAGGQGASEAIAWAQSLLNQAASVRKIQTRSS
ncbi:DNA repair protein RecN [Laspinema olomoucense]|uniref:DNA repair protein RecN n=1 Tax=Laspinema olomoucense D3b TaxID=2953688 RepID=A0ABT2NB86_9CYAN|nr:DNA repair protein RecN [Laspinema sp. D3b]MCT7979947.1 DNA repair protein RecN [Laspinema sp. D3b]